MTIIKNTLFIIAAAMITLGCGEDDSPTIDPIQQVVDGLEKTWSATSVTFQSQDVTANWGGFTLAFDQNKGYTATSLSDESVVVWPTSGSYSFPNLENANSVLRSDGVQISIEDLTDTNVRLVFQISGRNEGGREDALIGEWAFVMTGN
jgi:hypothetical protein